MPARIKIVKIPNWMLRRIGFLIVVLLAAIIINFIIPRLMPGDFTTLYVSSDMPPEVVAAIRKRLGLDQPLWSQFIIYIKNTLTLNFGNSYFYSTTSVASMIATRLPRTLAILIPSEIICVAIGYYFGVISGWSAGSKRDSLITGVSIII